MQLSPLQLEGYFLKEVSFSVNEEINEKPTELKKSDNIGIEVEVSVVPLDDENTHWRCELTLDLKPKNDPKSAYNLHLVLVGFFFVLDAYPKDKAELLAKTNCPAILYSTAREMVVTVVRRSPFAPVLIPSVSFLEIEKKQVKSEAPKALKSKTSQTKKSVKGKNK